PPRHPVTGRLNFLTSRSVNGPGLSRASRTGLEPFRTSMWDPSGASNTRRPSHHTRPAEEERWRISTAKTELGPTTIGRVNSAWALIGTSSNASTSGHTTGPPPEKAYAV